MLSGTFRKRNIQFDLRESLNEVMDLTQYKAKIKGINVKLEAKFSDDG